MVKSYRDLEVWRLGLDLAETIYGYTAGFPKSEIFALSSQMRRAAVSIPSNIAEGQARSSSKEFLHFLSIVLGYLAELETQIELATRLEYLDAHLDVARAQIQVLGKKLHCLRNSLRDRLIRTSHQPLATSP
jgi:four helix bundle protein